MAWRVEFSEQQATTVKRALTVRDYAVELEGAVVGAVERKTLAGSLLIMLAELATVPRAAIVVEDR